MGEVGWSIDGGRGGVVVGWGEDGLGRMVRERHFFAITKYIWEYVYIACLRLFIIYGVGRGQRFRGRDTFLAKSRWRGAHKIVNTEMGPEV